MNIENLNIIADAVEKGSIEFNGDIYTFDMKYVINEENKKACIKGFAEILFCDGNHMSRGHIYDVFGRPPSTLYPLFYPPADPIRYYDASPKEAARVIRNYISTGKVDWSIIDE